MRRLTNGDAGTTPGRGRAQARPRRFVVALVALLANVASAAASDVTVKVEHKDEVYGVRGRFETTVPVKVAWEVLTDYEGIPRFVNSMKRSQVVGRDSAGLRLRQTATVGVFPARKTSHILLEVREQAPHRIQFHDVSRQDFHQYEGAWELAADSARITVSYTLDARPRSPILHVFGRSMMSHAAQDLLKQVRTEMERRAKGR